MNKDFLAIKAAGKVTVSLVKDGESTPIASFHNDLQDTGLEVIAQALCDTSSINYMYLLYTNAASPTDIITTGSLTAEDLQETDMDKGFIRVPISGRSVAETVLTFQGVTIAAATAAAEASGSPAVTDGTSNFYAAGLVMAPVAADALDILFSAAQFTNQEGNFFITKIANAQIGISWEVTISKGA